ncbi:MAG: hypothetical protein IKW13_06310 [Thermoguttaceae bacterium]|nr:hypothetical protein [Thermoguttaceae bacterium]
MRFHPSQASVAATLYFTRKRSSFQAAPRYFTDLYARLVFALVPNALPFSPVASSRVK